MTLLFLLSSNNRVSLGGGRGKQGKAQEWPLLDPPQPSGVPFGQHRPVGWLEKDKYSLLQNERGDLAAAKPQEQICRVQPRLPARAGFVASLGDI